MSASAPVDLESISQELAQHASSLAADQSEATWSRIEELCKELANNLRSRSGPNDNHTLLGKTQLPQSLKSLLASALSGQSIPEDNRTGPILQILRVAANLCMDHDDNRATLLEVQLPQAAVSILEGYAENISLTSSAFVPLDLTTSHLRIIQTSIGLLLNASLNYDPVKTRLNSLEAGLTIIKISVSVFPPTAWALEQTLTNAVTENWRLRCTISNWSWRVASVLRDKDDETIQILNTTVLPWIAPHLLRFCPSHAPPSQTAVESDADLFEDLVQADFNFLEEACPLIESLSLDVEDFRRELPRTTCLPVTESVPCIDPVLDFIEHGTYPSAWESPVFDDKERASKKKSFDNFKAALIKSIVEVFGEENNEEVLWDDEKQGGAYVERMVRWVNQYVEAVKAGKDEETPSAYRDDMAICGTLSLGNMVRKVKVAKVLLSPPHSLAPILASEALLSASTDIKLKHGVLGLLKHLAQFSKLLPLVPTSFAEVSLVEKILATGIWQDKSDTMAEVVQLSAIGVVKHLCNASLEHTVATVIAPEGSEASALTQILALVKRSDSISVKSEGSRVLVNVVKTLWMGDRSPSDGPDDKEKSREVCVGKVLNTESAFVLAGLVARSKRYPILVNEGIVALSLFCTNKLGAPLVLENLTALVAPAPPSSVEEAVSQTSEPSASETGQGKSASGRGGLLNPKHALDMLVGVLKNVDNPVNFPLEVRLNACTFFVQLQRHNSPEALAGIRDVVAPVLQELVEEGQDPASPQDAKLGKAAATALENWKPGKSQ